MAIETVLVIVLLALVSQSSGLGFTPRELTLYKFTDAEANLYGARCLDCGVSGYYYSLTTNPLYKNFWVIALQGGGYCIPFGVSPNSCLARSVTTLGTSKRWEATISTDSIVLFTSVPTDYNIVYIPYCGGDVHTGSNNESVNNLCYSGHNTVAAVIQKFKPSLLNATKVILAGVSAGAVGTLINFDYLQREIPGVNLWLVCNSGWFLPEQKPYNSTSTIDPESAFWSVAYSTFNSYVNQACKADHPSKPSECISVPNTFKYVNVPIFFAESLFDTEQLTSLNANFDFNADPQSNLYVVNFGMTKRSQLTPFISGNSSIGLYATATFDHGIDGNDTTSGVSLNTTVLAWLRSSPSNIMSTCLTPNCQPIMLPNGTFPANAASTTSANGGTSAASTTAATAGTTSTSSAATTSSAASSTSGAASSTTSTPSPSPSTSSAASSTSSSPSPSTTTSSDNDNSSAASSLTFSAGTN